MQSNIGERERSLLVCYQGKEGKQATINKLVLTKDSGDIGAALLL
jgi:hypothetical protein